VAAGADGPPVKTRRKEVHALSRAVSRLTPTACAKERDAAQAPPLHWIGPSGTAFGKRKPRKLPENWVTLAGLRKRTGRVGLTPVALQKDSPLTLRTTEPSDISLRMLHSEWEHVQCAPWCLALLFPLCPAPPQSARSWRRDCTTSNALRMP
jgi:hypothetical protein